MTRNELYHHGILGMKWGVRRYQNADGSLTAAGKKRYGNGTTSYGNVNVTKKGDTYHITDGERETYVDSRTLQVMSIASDDMMVKEVAAAMGVKYQQVEKWIDELSEPELKQINALVDEYMGMTLATVLKSSELGSKYNVKDVKKSNGKDVKTSSSSTPKYTQEQAIDKAYSDLEKKYSNFNDLPLEKQDELFFDYVNESGLYEYI